MYKLQIRKPFMIVYFHIILFFIISYRKLEILVSVYKNHSLSKLSHLQEFTFKLHLRLRFVSLSPFILRFIIWLGYSFPSPFCNVTHYHLDGWVYPFSANTNCIESSLELPNKCLCFIAI